MTLKNSIKEKREGIISVIVPIYNVEKYLEQCIDSVLMQSYKNIEIILVDDGSTDASSKICDAYAKKDSRIIVIHKKNGGLSDARNVGLKHATGEFIAFVDGDDYIDKNMYSTLIELLKKHNSDMAICTWKIPNRKDEKRSYAKEMVLENDENIEFFIMGKEGCKISPSVWDRLYRREVLKGLLFPEGKCYEDILWSTQVFHRTRKSVYINIPFYNYRQREESISNTDYKEDEGITERILTEQIPQLEEQIHYLQKNNFQRLADECTYNLYELLLKYYCVSMFKQDKIIIVKLKKKLMKYRGWARKYFGQCEKKNRKVILGATIYFFHISTFAFGIWIKIRNINNKR